MLPELYFSEKSQVVGHLSISTRSLRETDLQTRFWCQLVRLPGTVPEASGCLSMYFITLWGPKPGIRNPSLL
jgi:hypothetical protein